MQHALQNMSFHHLIIPPQACCLLQKSNELTIPECIDRLVVDPILDYLYTPRAFRKGSVKRVSQSMLKVGSIQLVIMLVGAIVAWHYLGEQAILPAMYGGAIALANTMMLAQRVKKAGELAKDNPQLSVNTLYVGMAQRIVFVLAALGVGLGLLKLLPLPLLGVFMAAQLAYVFAGSQKIEA